jgi:hypothetical protein
MGSGVRIEAPGFELPLEVLFGEEDEGGQA